METRNEMYGNVDRHMRTINQIVNEFKRQDPDSQVSRGFVSKLIEENKVAHTKMGNRTLVIIEDVYKYVNGMRA